ncbi:MAG: hypothetical protein NVS3B12_25740 [Acidimicrobiales bacterium]
MEGDRPVVAVITDDVHGVGMLTREQTIEDHREAPLRDAATPPLGKFDQLGAHLWVESPLPAHVGCDTEVGAPAHRLADVAHRRLVEAERVDVDERFVAVMQRVKAAGPCHRRRGVAGPNDKRCPPSHRATPEVLIERGP